MNGQSLTKAFAPLPDGAVATCNAAGLEYYRHPDWLGSSRLASTPARTIYGDIAYAPFGETYSQTGSFDLSFTGQNQDAVPGLYDYLYRENNSTQGRWISPDPTGSAAVDLNDPQSWNRYAYVRNSPLSLVDSDGTTYFVYNNCVYNEVLQPISEGRFITVTYFVGCLPSPGSTASGGSSGRTMVKPSSCPSIGRELLNIAALTSNTILAQQLGQAYLLAQLTGDTVIVGVSASAGKAFAQALGGSVSVNVGIAVDPQGDVAAIGSGRVGGGYTQSDPKPGTDGIGYFIGGSLTFSPSQSVFGLQSPNASLSGTVSGGNGEIGGSVSVSLSGTFSIAVGTGTGLFATAGGVSKPFFFKPLVCRQ